MLERYVYEYRREGVRLTGAQLAELLRFPEGWKGVVVVDLGLARVGVRVSGGELVLGSQVLERELLRSVRLRDDVVYWVRDGRVSALEVRAGGKYYKLKSAAPDKAPTVEISGIHMHRVVGVDPWTDSLTKVRAVRVRRGDVVLDTCTGLGYTAILSLKRGASLVYTVEVDDAVLWLAERNPWSRWLEDPRLWLVRGDVTEVVREFEDGFFTKVIHDPPRLTGEYGELYSTEFYRELWRVLRPGGLLYHYTGDPGASAARNIPGSVAGRLKKVGFVVRADPESAGVVARKPA